MPYGYKQPGNWKTIRKRILARDEHACYICGGPATQVDAIVPESQGGTHADDANLGAICVTHHEAKSKAERVAGRKRARLEGAKRGEQHPGVISHVT